MILYADEINEIVDNLNSYIELFLNYGEKSRTEQIAYATATFNSDITYIGIFSDNQSKITLTNTTSHKLQRSLYLGFQVLLYLMIITLVKHILG